MDRHETDVVSLTFAMIFMAVGALFLSGQVDAGDFVRMWALPLLLVAVGLVLGASAMARYQRSKRAGEGATDGDDQSHPPLW